ncbi:phosphate ABC transporter permease subunit PstC [Sandarakinorhabdus limnophila]|uniref:phosphate ABC transporter permease subunit PstC n=1 Tax=Sandarakinorhabdus limnophila TaxID=210512 RepID=UPI0026EC9053|nr:phosphate ABC transporter permease subunit PstC [Sandarakinorhabdus limnophila]MCM0033213.1 phosphate ABC transporter permease subunit PstC [Sandarakinorhabdus limnophila]
MRLLIAFALVLGLAGLAYLAGRARGNRMVTATGGRMGAVHSRPVYHGAYVAVLALAPALIVLAVWGIVGEGLIEGQVLGSLSAAERPAPGNDSEALLNEVRGLVNGDLPQAFNPLAPRLAPVYAAARSNGDLLAGALAVALLAMGGLWGWSRLRPDFRARNRVETQVRALLLVSSVVAILTTFGIVLSLIFESIRFFQLVSPVEFLTGLQWSPQTAIRADQVGSTGAFGAVPLFWGTIFIGAIIAMAVAIPLGLMSAIYLTQYADPRVRKWLKPILELLAGVPTVVYGFFAALTIAPLVRSFAVALGMTNASSDSALAAGLVMGVMIIPFVSSMADDALAAVPRAMRDGSLAMGATPSETVKKVLVPAALPGIMGGVLLAVSRAIGETMIVVMAAGLAANLTANPFSSVTTVTTQIVALLTGDQEFDSAKTLSAFALGLVLFVMTLILNIYALAVVKRYREAYE